MAYSWYQQKLAEEMRRRAQAPGAAQPQMGPPRSLANQATPLDPRALQPQMGPPGGLAPAPLAQPMATAATAAARQQAVQPPAAPPVQSQAPTGQLTPAGGRQGWMMGEKGVSPEALSLLTGGDAAEEAFAQGGRTGDIAEQMRAEALQPIRGRMVGRVYVPASIAEGGAQLIKAYVAMRKEKEQKEERATASKERAELKAQLVRALNRQQGNRTAVAPGTMRERAQALRGV